MHMRWVNRDAGRRAIVNKSIAEGQVARRPYMYLLVIGNFPSLETFLAAILLRIRMGGGRRSARSSALQHKKNPRSAPLLRRWPQLLRPAPRLPHDDPPGGAIRRCTRRVRPPVPFFSSPLLASQVPFGNELRPCSPTKGTRKVIGSRCIFGRQK